jgi:hypothetical protein
MLAPEGDGSAASAAATAAPSVCLGPCCSPHGSAKSGDGFTGDGGGTTVLQFDYGELHTLSFEQYMALPEVTRAMFSKACPNGHCCTMGARCVRIHGSAEPKQQQSIDRLALTRPEVASRYGVIACRDYLLLAEGCPRGAKCGYRHINISRPLTALQVCALLMSFFMRVARMRSDEIACANERGSGFPPHHAHALIPDF